MCRALRPLTICLVLNAIVLPLCAETVQEIADRIVFARGGRAKMQSVQTERIAGQMTAGEQVGSFVMEIKRPNKIRFEVDLNGASLTRAFDGKSGWEITSAQPTPKLMNENETKRLIGEGSLDGPFLDYDKKGTKIEIIDKEMLGSSLVWKLKITLKSGEVEYYYVESTGYFVLLREQVTTTDGQESVFRQFYQNFQYVEDVPFPSTVIAENGASDEPIRMKFEMIELNVPEADSRFTLAASSSK